MLGMGLSRQTRKWRFCLLKFLHYLSNGGFRYNRPNNDHYSSIDSKWRQDVYAYSSYWVYLIHFQIIIALQVLVSDWSSVGVKVLFINIVTFAITLLSYQCLVRFTWIGRWLNGQRYIRSRWTGRENFKSKGLWPS